MKDKLFEIKCKTCKKYFLYHFRNGNDFRCYNCRRGVSVEAIQKELEEMSEEEYQSFVQDIKEYEKQIKKRGM